MKSLFRTHQFHLLLGCITLAMVFVSCIYPFLLIEQKVPGGSMYGFLTSDSQDFFQYVAMIRRGLVHGELLLHNPYSPPSYPPILAHPLFTMLGNLARIIHIDQFQMYFYSRIVSLLVFIFCVYRLIFRVLKTTTGRLLAVVLFYTATAIWEYSICAGVTCLVDPTTYSRSELNALYRLVLLPHHHYLSLSALIILFFNLTPPKLTVGAGMITIVLGVALALLQPYIGTYALGMCIVYLCISIVARKKESLPLLLHIIILSVVLIPLLYITKRNAETVFGASISFFTSAAGPRVDLITYAKAMGLVTIPFIIGMLTISKWRKNSLIVLTALWALLTAVWYYTPLGFFAGSPHRLLQLMPQVPMAIIGALGVVYITARLHRFGIIIISIIAAIFIAYVLPLYTIGIPHHTSYANPEFYNYYLFSFLRPIVPLLNSDSEKGRVMIGGDRISNMVTSVTSTYVVNGHMGNTPDYPLHADDVRQFFYGFSDHAAVTAFLKKYQASTVLFGVDSIDFSLYKNADYPYFTKLYDQGGVTLMKVMPMNNE